jgi:transposase
LGRARSGFSTKIHAGSIDETTGVSFVLTGGQRHDAPGFDAVFAQLPQEQALEQAIRDRGYDSNHIRRSLQAQDITPVIPPKKNRKASMAYDEAQYKLREKVERFFNRLKQFRRIATRPNFRAIAVLDIICVNRSNRQNFCARCNSVAGGCTISTDIIISS